MIYELSLVAQPQISEVQLKSLKKIIDDVLESTGGEVLVDDDWGSLRLAQSTRLGKDTGYFIYRMFKSDGSSNKELSRLFQINEDVMRSLIFQVSSDDQEASNLAKAYKTPFSKRHYGSQVEGFDREDEQKGKKRIIRRRKCWFVSKDIRADWKDPHTYSWLLNEFGKISPARVTGTSRKHQTFAVKSIKRARQLGIISYISSAIARPLDSSPRE